MRLTRVVPIASVVFASCLTLGFGLVQDPDECTADVSVTLRDDNDDFSEGDESITTFRFDVAAYVEEDGCWMVSYDLQLDLLNAEGEETQEHKRGQIKVQGGEEVNEVVEYQMPAGGELLEYEIVHSSCGGC